MAAATPPETSEDDWDRQVMLLLDRHGGPDSAHPSPWQLTPQMAFRLIVAADSITDLDEDERGAALAAALPLRLLASATPEFIDRFRRCYADLSERIARAELPADRWPFLARCVGEEVALDHLLEVVREDHESGHAEDLFADELGRLATDPRRDADVDHYQDSLFKDRDFQVLSSPRHDGIEDDQAIAGRLGYSNLQSARWFLPFSDSI